MPYKMKPEDYPPYTPTPVVLPDDDDAAILEIREFAAMVWREITQVFGPSILFVRMITAPRRLYRQTLDWLRNLELLVRRLITITALSLTLPPVKPAKRSPGTAPDFRRISGHWSDVESWNVSFRILPPAPRAPRPSTAGLPRKPARHFVSTYSIARRIEALRRVLSYHTAYARRFARSLERCRARTPRSNDKVLLGVKPWKFHPYMSSKGQHAVRHIMPLTVGLCQRALARWQGLEPRPG